MNHNEVFAMFDELDAAVAKALGSGTFVACSAE